MMIGDKCIWPIIQILCLPILLIEASTCYEEQIYIFNNIRGYVELNKINSIKHIGRLLFIVTNNHLISFPLVRSLLVGCVNRLGVAGARARESIARPFYYDMKQTVKSFFSQRCSFSLF